MDSKNNELLVFVKNEKNKNFQILKYEDVVEVELLN